MTELNVGGHFQPGMRSEYAISKAVTAVAHPAFLNPTDEAALSSSTTVARCHREAIFQMIPHPDDPKPTRDLPTTNGKLRHICLQLASPDGNGEIIMIRLFDLASLDPQKHRKVFIYNIMIYESPEKTKQMQARKTTSEMENHEIRNGFRNGFPKRLRAGKRPREPGNPRESRETAERAGKPHFGPFRVPVSDFGLSVSDFGKAVSDFGNAVSDFGHAVSGTRENSATQYVSDFRNDHEETTT